MQNCPNLNSAYQRHTGKIKKKKKNFYDHDGKLLLFTKEKGNNFFPGKKF